MIWSDLICSPCALLPSVPSPVSPTWAFSCQLVINVGLIVLDGNLKMSNLSPQKKMQHILPPPLPLLGQDGQDRWSASSPVVDMSSIQIFIRLQYFQTFDQIVGLTMVTVNWSIYSPLLQALSRRKLAIQVGNWSHQPHCLCLSIG